MSDFHLYLGVTRGELSEALTDNPEQALWVLCAVSERMSAAELGGFADTIHERDRADVAAFYRRLADEIHPPAGGASEAA